MAGRGAGVSSAARAVTTRLERGELSFRNGGYRYVIRDGERGLAVAVSHRGKTVLLLAAAASRTGALADLKLAQVDNVVRSTTN